MTLIFKYFTLFGFSLLFNSLGFILINLGFLVLGLREEKDKFNSLIYEKNNKISFLIFIFVFLFLFYLQFNLIHLDNDIAVKPVIDGVDVKVKGNLLKLVLDHFGTAAVFATGLKISTLLVKKNMAMINKISIIGAGYTLFYKVAIAEKIQESTINTVNFQGNRIEIFLDKLSHNWKNKFYTLDIYPNFDIINSLSLSTSLVSTKGDGIEKSELLKINHAVDILITNLSLHYIILYLVFMALLIFTCKLLIEKNVKLDNIKFLPLGNYIHFTLNKLLNIWKVNANVWIYFILINVFIFTFGCSYSLYNVITLLNNL